jgi:hypothetical protein
MRADDFKLPGGAKSFGELKDEYDEEFATKSFDAMERIQASEGNVGELMRLYFDWCARKEGRDHIVLGPEPSIHHADPEKKGLKFRPVAKGGDE